MIFLLIRAGSSTALKGVSAIDFPACLFNSGLTSKDSRWERPPHRKIQMTDLARGRKWALPLGGVQVAWVGAALAFRSPNSMAPSARPVNPMPVSKRKERRETPGQQD